MKRPLRPEETRIWAMVAASVRPAPGRMRPPVPPQPEAAQAPPPTPPPPAAAHRELARAPSAAASALYAIEPGRRRRLVRGRDAIEARLDLHGLDQDRARLRLAGFLRQAQRDGLRSVLVITGKGMGGEGVLRRRIPEWLSDPALRSVVAGVSQADRRHGGEGALYVGLKRRPSGGRP